MKSTAFKEWLSRHGSEVLAPTNPYEWARFRARGGTHVIYEGRRGITASGFARECLDAFSQKKPLDMGLTATQRNSTIRVKAALLQRDGDKCFFCIQPMPSDDITLEHLVGIAKGGPNHMDNYALAHGACNRKADNLPLIAKIRMREDSIKA